MIGVIKTDGYGHGAVAIANKIKDYDFLDIKEKRKAPKCKECMFNNCCIGVWKEYIEQFKNCLDLYPIKKEDL